MGFTNEWPIKFKGIPKLKFTYTIKPFGYFKMIGFYQIYFGVFLINDLSLSNFWKWALGVNEKGTGGKIFGRLRKVSLCVDG